MYISVKSIQNGYLVTVMNRAGRDIEIYCAEAEAVKTAVADAILSWEVSGKIGS